MKKIELKCWKVFKSGLTDTPLKRLSYIEKEGDVLYYRPMQPEAHYGHDLVSCLNCGEIYAIPISVEMYHEPREAKLKKTNCVNCAKNLEETAKSYPDFYLGKDQKVYKALKKYGDENDDNMIFREFWDLYSE